ncbi:hypothetical protein HanRHA438_Chr03g0109591 [Helianthus annuus]|nr:hypothetical protein HanRHA438_Chr03g0109591 [Helianthus annuus]
MQLPNKRSADGGFVLVLSTTTGEARARWSPLHSSDILDRYLLKKERGGFG